MSEQTQQGGGRSIWYWLAMLVFIVPMAVFLLPTTVVLAVLMLPTIVALLTDSTPGRSVLVTVGLLNGVGSMPAVFEVWSQGHYLVEALAVIGQPIYWLIAYVAAGLGWTIFLGLPPILRQYYQVATDLRVKQLKKRQDELEDLWGEAVSGKQAAGDEPDKEEPAAFKG